VASSFPLRLRPLLYKPADGFGAIWFAHFARSFLTSRKALDANFLVCSAVPLSRGRSPRTRSMGSASRQQCLFPCRGHREHLPCGLEWRGSYGRSPRMDHRAGRSPILI
jgi:hypothetical protein